MKLNYMIPHDKLYVHMPYARLMHNLEEFCQSGTNCEIYITAQGIDSSDKKEFKKINTTFDKYNLKKSIHSCFMDLNPGSMDEEIRKISFKRLKQCLDICAELKADRMVAHTHFSPIFYKSQKKRWIEDSLKVWEPLSKHANKNGIAIAIENSLDDSCWAVLEILKRVQDFKACFDIAHYNVFSPLGWQGELEKYPKGAILEVHISDNKGDFDQHLPLGEGNIDFKKFFKLLNDKKIEPFITIEPHDKEGMIKGLEYIKNL